MTTFDEAARALLMGRELLQDLAAIQLAHPSECELAAELLDGYPTAQAINGQLHQLDANGLALAVSCIHQTGMLLTRLTVSTSTSLAERARRISRHFPRTRAIDAATTENARTWAAHELNCHPGRYGLIAKLARQREARALEARARLAGWIDAEGFWCARPGEEELP